MRSLVPLAAFSVGFGLLCLWPATLLAEEAPEVILWEAPPSGAFALTPMAGYSLGSQIDGAVVGLQGSFLMEYLVLGLEARSTFIPEGAMYSFGLIVDGRYGPFYGGVGLCMDWLPGRSLAQNPTLTFQAGLHVWSPFEGVWVDLSYRPHIAFSMSQPMVTHAITIGLVFPIRS